ERALRFGPTGLGPLGGLWPARPGLPLRRSSRRRSRSSRSPGPDFGGSRRPCVPFGLFRGPRRAPGIPLTSAPHGSGRSRSLPARSGRGPRGAPALFPASNARKGILRAPRDPRGGVPGGSLVGEAGGLSVGTLLRPGRASADLHGARLG